MICQLDKNDWCERHQRKHFGRVKELALMDNALGESYRLLWDRGLSDTKQERQLECIHLGDILDRLDCDCQWKWIRECDKYGRCTLAVTDGKLHSCATCPDYQPEPV